MTESLVPLAAVLTPLGAIPLIVASNKWRDIREAWTLLAAFGAFFLVASLIPWVDASTAVGSGSFELVRGIALELRVDQTGLFFGLIASGLWVVTCFYSIGYVRAHQEGHQTRYFASFAACIGSTLGVAFAGNLVTFLVFYEMLSLATYPLVIHSESPRAIRSGRKYLTYALTAGVLLLAAVIWTGQAAGTYEFTAGGILNPGALSAPSMRILFLLFIAGVGVKAGLMPLHGWLPAAMVAPTPVSALLHAVAVVKSGVFGIIRVVGFVFGPETMRGYGLDSILLLVAGVTILLASCIALRSDNLKRRLAYSTIGHLSYIVLGVALLNREGFAGGMLHMVNHATMKITLFFCAGAIIVHLHKDNVSQLNGIGRAMPWTMGAFAIGALGLAGVPPVNGFLSKWMLCEGSTKLTMAVLLTSGLLNAAYFFPIVHRAFFRPPDEGVAEKGEAPLMMLIPICIVASLSLILFFWPDLFLGMARDVANAVMDG
ncbi:MAG: monovalent cation/H+ antiporter subunit D family protein [Planctomycetota bacterium]|jgi:multicomponent Na+:H+ antiporter subunit D